MSALTAAAAAPGVVVALVGLPAAGKSTIARGLVGASASLHVEVVRFDDDLEATGALADASSFDAAKWRASRASALGRVAALLEAPPRADGKALVVVADDNAQYRSMRHALFQSARDRGFAFATAYVACDLGECLARNARRAEAERVPEATLATMASQLEAPDASKAPWERHSLRCASADPDAPAAVLALAAAARLAGAPPPLEDPAVAAERLRAAREATAASDAHSVDLRLRRAVGDVAAAAAKALPSKKHRAALGSALAKARKRACDDAAGGGDRGAVDVFAADALARLAVADPPFDEAALAAVRAALGAIDAAS